MQFDEELSYLAKKKEKKRHRHSIDYILHLHHYHYIGSFNMIQSDHHILISNIDIYLVTLWESSVWKII